MSCNHCGERLIARATDAETTGICARCSELGAVRDAFDAVAMEVAQYGDTDPERAFRILDQLFAAHEAQDHDGWLQRSVRYQRALILGIHGRFAEALQELRSVPPECLVSSDDLAAHKGELAWALEHLSAPDEALRELAEAISLWKDLRAERILELLAHYAEIANKIGISVPEEMRQALRKVVEDWEFDLMEDARTSSLNVIIPHTQKQRVEAARRYESLLEQLRGKSRKERAQMLTRHAEGEPVGFFRELARRSAEGLAGS